MLWIILPNSYWKLPGWLVALDDAEGDDDDVSDAGPARVYDSNSY